MKSFLGFVGVAMFLGLGAAWLGAFRELKSLTQPPLTLTVHEASTRADLHGAWVELTDARFPCELEEQSASTTPYRLGFGETTNDRVIVRGHVECSRTPTLLRGVLEVGPAGGIADLSFPGYDFAAWPTPNQLVLSPTSPEEVREGLWTLPPFAFLGLIIAAFYWRSKPATTSTFANLEPESDPTPWSPDERVLPAGPLRFASAGVVDRIWSVAGLVNIAWIFFTLAWIFEGWLGRGFFGALGLLMVVGGVRVIAGWRSHNQLDAVRHEALAKVLSDEPMLANGVDVGNRMVRVAHPLTGAMVERVRTANDPPMLRLGDQVFVVWSTDPDALIIVADGFLPFALPPAEVRAALRRLRRFARAG